MMKDSVQNSQQPNRYNKAITTITDAICEQPTRKYQPIVDVVKERNRLKVKSILKNEAKDQQLQSKTKILKRSTNNIEIPEKEDSKALFTTDFFYEKTPIDRNVLLTAIEMCLREKLILSEKDRLANAVSLLYTFNREKSRNDAIQMIYLCLQNIVLNPNQEKYRRLRVSNSSFHEKIVKVNGALECLLATGFDYDPSNEYLVFKQEKFIDIVENIGTILDGKAIEIRVARETRVFKRGVQLPTAPLPEHFFEPTVSELFKEQLWLTKEAVQMLEVKSRRQIEQKRAKIYHYTIIRVSLGDDLVLQGAFEVNDTIEMVREWIVAQLSDVYQVIPFDLKRSRMCGPLLNGDILSSMNLVPSALLHLDWLASVDKTISPLSAHSLKNLEPLI